MTDELVPVARLFGHLLVRELDAATLASLRDPGVAEPLRELGVELPDADLDELAAEFCTALLTPGLGAPPVQSLWSEGRYDGDAAGGVRAIARAAGLEPTAASAATPPDHIGGILCLWADLAFERPELAAQLRRSHLAWAGPALERLGEVGGFYGAVARAGAALVREIARDA